MNAPTYEKLASEIRPLAEGHGACIASNMITIDGHQVGYMYRERPVNAVDSGWRFFSGHESQEYVDDAANLAFYDCNTIANYDPDIIEHLQASEGTAFERSENGGSFVQVDFDPPE